MKIWHCITLCLVSSLVMAQTIGTSPVDISGNGLADSSGSVNSELSKSIEDMNVEELGAMIDQMLARLKTTQNNYPNTTAEVPSQIINPPTSTPNTSSPTQQPKEIPKSEKPPSANNNPAPTPVDNTQTQSSRSVDFSPISQPGSGRLENTQQDTVASSSQNQAQQEQKSSNPSSNGSVSQDKSTPKSQSTTRQNSHQIKADIIPPSSQTNVDEQARNSDDSSKKQSSQVVNDLLSGDYFTYFVDLNADKTGNVFLNDPDKKQTTQEDKKKGQIKFQQPANQQAYNQLNAPQQKNETTITHNTTSQIKNTGQNNAASSENAKKTSQSINNNLQQQPEEKKPSESTTNSSQSKESTRTEPPIKLPNRNINSVSLCYTDDDCKYDYIMFVGMGLQVKCKSGACIPIY